MNQKMSENKINYEGKTHIVWDWNGTLFSDMDVCIEIENEFLRERNLPEMKSVEEYQTFFKFPIKEFYEDLGLDFESESYENLCEIFVKEYEDRICRCDLNEGTEDVLKAFQKSGVRQTIISASGQSSLYNQVNPFNISDYFTDILGIEDNLAASKVHLAKSWIETNHLPIEEILFFGDTEHDFEVAKEVGCDCVLIADGHHSKEKLLNTGAVVIDKITDVISLFEKTM